MVGNYRVESTKEGTLVNPRNTFCYLHQPFPAEADINRVTQGVDEVPDLKTTGIQLATISTYIAIGPNAFGVVLHDITSAFPQFLVVEPIGMTMNSLDGNAVVQQDGVP